MGFQIQTTATARNPLLSISGGDSRMGCTIGVFKAQPGGTVTVNKLPSLGAGR